MVGRTDDTTLLAGVPLVFMVLEDAQDLVFRSRDVISAVLVDGEPTSVPDGMVAMPADEVAAGHAASPRRCDRIDRPRADPACGSWPP